MDTVEADETHRGHGIIEQVHSDLKSGPLAHVPSGVFTANSAWLVLAVIAFTLTRAAGLLADQAGRLAKATTATIRRTLIAVPARPPGTLRTADRNAPPGGLAMGSRVRGRSPPPTHRHRPRPVDHRRRGTMKHLSGRPGCDALDSPLPLNVTAPVNVAPTAPRPIGWIEVEAPHRERDLHNPAQPRHGQSGRTRTTFIRQRIGIPSSVLAAPLGIPYPPLRRLEIGVRANPELEQPRNPRPHSPQPTAGRLTAGGASAHGDFIILIWCCGHCQLSWPSMSNWVLRTPDVHNSQ